MYLRCIIIVFPTIFYEREAIHITAISVITQHVREMIKWLAEEKYGAARGKIKLSYERNGNKRIQKGTLEYLLVETDVQEKVCKSR